LIVLFVYGHWNYFNFPHPSSHIMDLLLTQFLTEMSTGNFSGGKEQPAREIDNRTIYEPNVYRMCEHRRLKASLSSTVSYRDGFNFLKL
jgi:hypothetical protein